MKKKTNRVAQLVVEYIRENTIDICDFFKIFDPHVKFKKNTGDSNPTRFMRKEEITNHDDYNTLLGQLTFSINYHEAKKKNIRTFRVHQEYQYYLWGYEWYEKGGTYNIGGPYNRADIYFSVGFGKKVYDNPAMYHFIREMKKIVPNCLIEIEKLLFMRL